MTEPAWSPLRPADLIVRKEGYSRDPWRIIHVPTGKELAWERELYEPLDGPVMMLPKPGYRTKTLAVDARDRYLDEQTMVLIRIANAAKAYMVSRDVNAPGWEGIKEAEALWALGDLVERLEPA